MFDKAPNRRVISVPCGHEVFEHPEAQHSCIDLITGRSQSL